MSHNLYVTDDLVVLGIDDSDFSVVFSSVSTAISDVNKLRLRFIDHAVRSWLEMDRIEEFQRVPSKYAEHPVIAACQEQLIQFRDEQCSLCLLKSGDAAHPLASLQVLHLKGAIFQPRQETAFTLDIHINVDEPDLEIRQGDRLDEPKRLISNLLRKGNPAVSNEQAGND